MSRFVFSVFFTLLRGINLKLHQLTNGLVQLKKVSKAQILIFVTKKYLSFFDKLIILVLFVDRKNCKAKKKLSSSHISLVVKKKVVFYYCDRRFSISS